MNRVISLTAALMVLVAGFAVLDQSQAEARGLFNRDKCCKPAKKCRTPRRSRDECCEPAACCEPIACCQPAPCVEATPACGACETQLASCNTCCPSRRELRKARKNCCAQTCGYETQGCNSCSSCGGGQVIQGAVVEGCTNCGGAAVEAPTPAAEAAPEAPAAEAAPEAPAADSTT